MPDSVPPAGTPCAECGFVNAVNSLYCQDCGAKLTVAAPSYLSAAPPAAPELAPASAAVRPPKPKKPRILSAQREASVGIVGVTIRTILYAAFVAALIQLFRAPRDLPPPAKAIDAVVVDQVRAKFSESARRGAPVDAPWDRTNAYLAGVLAPVAGSGSVFVRASVVPRPEGFGWITEKTISGRVPVYTEIDYRVVVRGNGLSLVPAGGAIGRLPFPAFAAPLLTIIGGDLSSSLKFELDLVANARSIQFSPASARIDFAPARP